MSENTNQMFAILVNIRNTIIKLGVEIQNELRFMASTFVKAILTGRNVGKTALGQEFKLTSKKDLFPQIDKIFAPKALPEEGGTPIKKLGKSLKGIFKDVAKSIGASFSPMMLLFQMLQPMIQAFLEPMDLLSPLFESWGTILSQALIPVVLALMDVLMPLTPLFDSIVANLLPILQILIPIVQILIPAIEAIVTILMFVFDIIGMLGAYMAVFITFIGGAVAWFSETVFGAIRNFMIGIVAVTTSIRNAISNFIDGVTAFWSNLVGGVRKKSIDLYNNTLGLIFGRLKEEEKNVGATATTTRNKGEVWY